MKTQTILFLLLSFVLTYPVFGQGIANDSTSSKKNKNMNNSQELHTYLIEREIPGAGALTSEQLKGISQTSCSVLDELGTGIQWLHSYVTDDKVYCVYKAVDQEILKEHAEKGGFPINKIQQLSAMIDPSTASN